MNIAPKAFTLKQREKKVITSSSPFSSDRDLNLPTYGNFDIKKSDKKATEFIPFDRPDDSWEVSKRFLALTEPQKLTDFLLMFCIYIYIS
jgi:hypothetical protein